ncbi:DUF1156 domain-containing protein [Mobiluncus mulieris]|uniref:DUF1156 domain-containing protein n=1 Tax=Mobiluncus mulieris TaxID=2052 RepID=UPI000E05643D|nr:DUF1156 domain-containing protein [Mobiluncus mulieris]STY84163.1 Protein of uncharacterised function (DUF1156) [Mobiluncus mulieris]
MPVKKKLIEVALPLDDINQAAAREKSIRHGHPSTLHLWWARRPLAAARAVIWASLVDDPSAHPEKFPTINEQETERQRLFQILKELVVWENSNDKRVLENAKAEIKKSLGDGELPPLLDPFAGGGAIPLEAQRLGLKAYAQDLNPVAVTINKAMIEIPPLFAGKSPVNPQAQDRASGDSWEGNSGLAADVEYYAQWMKAEAFKRIGHLYPQVKLTGTQGGGEATVIAWLWARTVPCPNPACGHPAILVRSFDLSRKKGKEWHVEPICDNGKIRFEVKPGKSPREGTVNRSGAICVHCSSPFDLKYVKKESKANRMGALQMAIVTEGTKGRIYISPDKNQIEAAKVNKPDEYPTGQLAKHFTGGSCVPYGLDEFDKLFTNRQLTALTTFSALVHEAQSRAEADALKAGWSDDGISLAERGSGAKAYGQAIGVYLAFVVDKLADRGSTICGWDVSREGLRNTFGRQAIPMTWDFAEANPFCASSGSFDNMTDWVVKVLKGLPLVPKQGNARQFDAQSDNGLRGIMVSTDPPYYDNIGYADLSDFFYIWLRQSLRDTYPKLFASMLVPKHEELVATPYRENRGKEGARVFFEEGMFQAFKQVYEYARADIPVTIYYAFKQSETTTTANGQATASTGWETMLSALIRAGFAITGTWPMHTEMSNRNIASGTNALASSIVLVCRKRAPEAPLGTRRDFVAALKRELEPALDKLRTSSIAPVDLAQSAIGPGMAVYSRYRQVLEADGSPLSVRTALQLINQQLDVYFSDQDGELDRESRFCVELYTQSAFNHIPFGEADVLARAKNVSIGNLTGQGLLSAQKGQVRLLTREELAPKIEPRGPRWLLMQQLVSALEKGGVVTCAKIVNNVGANHAENAKTLAYRLFTIADKKNWNTEAFAYNSLVTAWSEIQSQAARLAVDKSEAQVLF